MMMMMPFCAHCFVDEVWIHLLFRLFWLFNSQCLLRSRKWTGNYKIFEHPDLKFSNTLSVVSFVIVDSGLRSRFLRLTNYFRHLFRSFDGCGCNICADLVHLIDEVATFVLIWQRFHVVRSCQEELKIQQTSLVQYREIEVPQPQKGSTINRCRK